MRNNGSVQSIERALGILRLFSSREPELTLAEISARIELPKSTSHRLTMALVRSGFLTVGAGRGRYRLGLTAAQVGQVAIEQLRPNDAVRAELRALATESGETVGLVILQGSEVLVVERVESTMPLRFEYGIGTRLPAHCTASGKVLLAFDARWPEILVELHLEPHTPNTIMDPEAFRAELEQIRRDEYAVDNEALYLGLVCLAVPVRDRSGAVSAALALSGPSARMRPEHFDHLLKLLRRRAAGVALHLNGYPRTRPALAATAEE